MSEFENLGVFKLKDKPGRKGIYISFRLASRPISEAVALHIFKVAGENNKIKIQMEWGDKKEKKEGGEKK